MSKAEERALEVFPLKIDGDSRGSYDSNVVKRIVYQQGYEQAEKDLELTWEDMLRIDDIISEVYKDSDSCSAKNIYQEVLKRFKDYKEQKEK